MREGPWSGPNRIAQTLSATLAFAFLASVTATSDAHAARCGGSERWPVKMASDPEAGEIDADNVTDISVVDFNALEPSDAIDHDDEYDRMEAEKGVYRVHGYLAMFRLEPDGDYHLAITDETGRMTPGGRATRATGHSFVAEIPRPQCARGANNQYQGASRFEDEINAARDALAEGIAGVNPRRIAPASIPVTITGVLFFDFPHGQAGRTRQHQDPEGHAWVTELHPILAIEFGR